MAKRRRLTPAQSDYLDPLPDPAERPAALRPGFSAPPISQVAGEASASAALEEMAHALTTARAEGRLASRIPLEAVDPAWLMRDRMAADPEEMGALVESLRAHGQRVPIEVVELSPGRYGLISGWRRLSALKQLAEEAGETGSVLAVLRRPETSAEAYVAMVEENEIRAALSYYERARIVLRAVEAGVFPSEKAALQRLFDTASRAKRSKIGSFLGICRALGPVLRFPTAIPERLGLQLAQALEDPATALRITQDLSQRPAASAEEEAARLRALLSPAPPAPPAPPRRELAEGLFWEDRPGGKILLSGPRLDARGLREALELWLRIN